MLCIYGKINNSAYTHRDASFNHRDASYNRWDARFNRWVQSAPACIMKFV